MSYWVSVDEALPIGSLTAKTMISMKNNENPLIKIKFCSQKRYWNFENDSKSTHTSPKKKKKEKKKGERPEKWEMGCVRIGLVMKQKKSIRRLGYVAINEASVLQNLVDARNWCLSARKIISWSHAPLLHSFQCFIRAGSVFGDRCGIFNRDGAFYVIY